MSDRQCNCALGGNSLHGAGGGPLSRSLSLDLEVGKNDGRIHGLGRACGRDTDVSFTYIHRRGGLLEALSRVDELAEGSNFPLGRYVIDFDLLP